MEIAFYTEVMKQPNSGNVFLFSPRKIQCNKLCDLNE